MKITLLITALLIGVPNLIVAEEVEISGEYALVIACADTHHELSSYVVEPGPDKSTSPRHLLNISPEMQKDLRPGMKIKISGKKQKTVTKRMSKGQLRKEMALYIEKGIGLPYQTEDMPSIIKKMIKEDAKKDDQANGGNADAGHNHGAVQLKPMDDDNEVIEVRMMEHIEVTKIDVIK